MMYKENETTINPKMTTNTDPDRLSNLPDSILTTILSFLNPREIVQTCVLSKKWRNLWTFVPCLNFESDDFIIQDPNPIERREFNCEDLERFQNFVSTFLRLRNNWTDVQFFRLLKPEIWNRNKICVGLNNMWIRYALNHNVKKLVLYGHECIDLPGRLFTCESLEDLSLDLEYCSKDRDFIIPDFVFLPKLRKLHLSGLYMKGNYLDKLIFGCPNLESLILRFCDIKMTNNISFHSLKKIYLEDCDYINELGPSSFYISAPCVEYLKFWGHLGCGLVIKNISRVKKAKILFRYGLADELYNCEIICSLLVVENLNIEASYVLKDVLEGEIPNCSTFYNMKKLTLDASCMHCDFGSLSSFLKHCPNLEILTLYHDEQLCEHWNVDHTEKLKDENLGEIEKFGCDKLRLVEIVYYEGDLDGDWVIRRLMRSTIGINNVQIILRKTNLDLDADLDDMHEHFDLDDVDRHDFSRFV